MFPYTTTNAWDQIKGTVHEIIFALYIIYGACSVAHMYVCIRMQFIVCDASMRTIVYHTMYRHLKRLQIGMKIN